MDELEELRLISRQLRAKRKERQRMRAKCSQWNFWARNQPEYYQWAYEQALTPADLKVAEDLGEPVILDWEEGAAYYAHRHLIYRDLELLWVQEERLLKYLWNKVGKNGRYVYSLTDIANAHESTENYIYKHLRDFDWFKPRNKLPGKKTHNRILKVVPNE